MTVNDLTKQEKIAFLEMMKAFIGPYWSDDYWEDYVGICWAYRKTLDIFFSEVSHYEVMYIIWEELDKFIGPQKPKSAEVGDFWFSCTSKGSIARLKLLDRVIERIQNEPK